VEHIKEGEQELGDLLDKKKEVEEAEPLKDDVAYDDVVDKFLLGRV
jgi:hypothetical protein